MADRIFVSCYLQTMHTRKREAHSAMLRFLVNLCADLLPFARTRLMAQTTCSVAAANTGLPTEASQGTMSFLFSLYI